MQPAPCLRSALSASLQPRCFPELCPQENRLLSLVSDQSIPRKCLLLLFNTVLKICTPNLNSVVRR